MAFFPCSQHLLAFPEPPSFYGLLEPQAELAE